MLRGKRILLNRIKSLKSTAKMYRAAARQAEIDRDFAIERVKEVNAENRRLQARIRGAEALYGAAMQRVEELEKELGMRSEETERIPTRQEPRERGCSLDALCGGCATVAALPRNDMESASGESGSEVRA